MDSSLDSFKCRKILKIGSKQYCYYSLPAAEKNGLTGISKLPFSLKVLLENLLRHEDGRTVTREDIEGLVDWTNNRGSIEREIAFRPARVLMQDFTGVPAVVDLAAMRDAMQALGGDPKKINPLAPVDLVIDHSVMVDFFGTSKSFRQNVNLEYERNRERYTFLKWGQLAFDNFRVVPPGTGICHQVNLEYLARTVWTKREKHGRRMIETAYPDTLVGTDSHTTMVNGLAVLGWGVGGIEAEAAMLGQPISMLIPEVVGFRLEGALPQGTTATDLVLTVTQMLRRLGVVGKFIEFFGPGLGSLTVEDRATIANMAPEYGATCGFFPMSEETLAYMKSTGRPAPLLALARKYADCQGMLWTETSPAPVYSETITLDLATVEPSVAGPKRPQDRVALKDTAADFARLLSSEFKSGDGIGRRHRVDGCNYDLGHGDVVIAAITSCTNTSNPSVMIGAGLLARKAVARGLESKPWVKTSLAPGSQVVTEYLKSSGLQKDLDKLGFELVGYGCTTCIGNSGPLPDPIAETVRAKDLVVAAVLSGNRNFEGRINPEVRANYLASPPLVVAYALAGTLNIDLMNDPLGQSKNGEPVHLKDIWPTSREIADVMRRHVTAKAFRRRYGDVFKGDAEWRKIKVKPTLTYRWDVNSTYVQNPPYFTGMTLTPDSLSDIDGARILGLFLDSITTDHISPAGSIKPDSPAGRYLVSQDVSRIDFNSYGSRRGNHQVMMRGTFANIRIRNQMAPGVEGGITVHYPSGTHMPIYDAAMQYRADHTPLVIFAGKEYGTGSSRDWAAKGTKLLGVCAVIAQSFERIHRSNLIGMGVLPLQFMETDSWQSLGLSGPEVVTVHGIAEGLKPRKLLDLDIAFADGAHKRVKVMCRIDTLDELDYFRHGGILPYVLRNLAQAA
jgi:aconitate hydratase